jgi:hypothetical protein
LSLVLLDDPIQGFPPGIRKKENRSTPVTGEGERLSGPGRIEFCGERVFVLEPAQTLRGGLFSSDRYRQDRGLSAALCAAVESEVRPLAKRLQDVLGMLCH